MIKNKTQKIISMILLLALIAGCFVTAFTPTVSAANSLDALIAQVPKDAREFTASGSSGNELNGPVTLWWDYHPETQSGDVWMLVASKNAGKIATAARIETKDGFREGTVIDGVEKSKETDNVAYSLVKFEGIWLTGDENFDVSMNTNKEYKGGQWISGNLRDYFPQLVTVTYFDPDGVQLGVDTVMSGEKTIVWSWTAAKTGYKFEYWIDDEEITYVADQVITVSKNLNLYAVEELETFSYTVEYYYNGVQNTLQRELDTALFGEVIVTYVDKVIPGYKFDKVDGLPLTISEIDANNVIKVYYAIRTDLSYVVNYLEQDTDAVLADQKVVNGKTFGTEVTENAIDIVGYNKVDPTSATITIAVDGNVITFYYTARTDLSYVVNYLEQDTDAVLADQKVVGGQTYLAEVTESAIVITGYDQVAPTSVTITIAETGNVITFYYREIFTVTFELGDKNMGDKLVGETSFTGYSGDAMPIPPHPYAKFGYMFLGWKGSDGTYVKALDYTNPTDLTDYPETVSGSVTYTAQWALVNSKQTFPDKIPSETHFDQWWAEYGILCVSSSTTKDGNYEVYFADWFFDVYDSCTIAFGANTKKFDYEIVFTKDTITLWQITGNGAKEVKNDNIKYDYNMQCIRDGQHIITKEKNHNYGLDFGMSGTLQGVCFENPFGSGAKLAWLC
jgi:hypothetical protein